MIRVCFLGLAIVRACPTNVELALGVFLARRRLVMKSGGLNTSRERRGQEQSCEKRIKKAAGMNPAARWNASNVNPRRSRGLQSLV